MCVCVCYFYSIVSLALFSFVLFCRHNTSIIFFVSFSLVHFLAPHPPYSVLIRFVLSFCLPLYDAFRTVLFVVLLLFVLCCTVITCFVLFSFFSVLVCCFYFPSVVEQSNTRHAQRCFNCLWSVSFYVFANACNCLLFYHV